MISINNVKKTFKQLTAVNNLSLTIEEGQSVALLGPNGAGKTTLVEMIEGIRAAQKQVDVAANQLNKDVAAAIKNTEQQLKAQDREVEQKMKALERKMDDNIKKALDNPLANR